MYQHNHISHGVDRKAKGETCVYANSGTWEDQKTRDKNATIDQMH